MKEDLFIHFFNRELYRSLAIKEFQSANFVLKIVVLACSETIHIPLSSLWENWNQIHSDKKFIKLLYDSRQLEVVSDCVTIEEFIERNLGLYSFDRDRYRHIYFGSIRNLDWLRPTEYKETSATQAISDEIQIWGESPEAKLILPKKDAEFLEANKLKVINIDKSREGKALTVSLFSNHMSQNNILSIARFLSAYYIRDYCQWLNADIISGLPGNLKFYDYLSQEYPYHDIRVLFYVLSLAGITAKIVNQIKYKMWEAILSERDGGCSTRLIQQIVRCAVDNCKLIFEERSINVKDVCRYIASAIRGKSIKKVKSLNSLHDLELYNGNLQIIASQIQSNNYDGFYLPTIIQTKSRCVSMRQKLFISHSSEDREYVKLIVELLEAIGITEIFCSSVPGYGVPLSEDIYDYLKTEFNRFDLYILFVLSDHYYGSVASLNEMGAAWVLQKEYMCILLPGFEFKKIEGAVNPQKVGIKLDADYLDVFDYLNQWKEKLESLFDLVPISQARWERVRSDFVCAVRKLAVG